MISKAFMESLTINTGGQRLLEIVHGISIYIVANVNIPLLPTFPRPPDCSFGIRNLRTTASTTGELRALRRSSLLEMDS